MELKKFKDNMIKDKIFRTYMIAISSFFITLAFTIYNLTFGLIYNIAWNISISIYYALLMAIRGYILYTEHKIKNTNAIKEKRRKLYIRSSILLFLINLALIAPIALMVLDKKDPAIVGLIPAIAMAAYSTYKVTLAIYNYKKYRKNVNLTLRQLKVISLLDAIVSVVTLQNTMILANGGMTSEMRLLCSYTSFGFFVLLISISVLSFKKNIKN